MGYLIGVGKQKKIQIIGSQERKDSFLIYENHMGGACDWSPAGGDEATFETTAGQSMSPAGTNNHVLKITDADGTGAKATLFLSTAMKGRIKIDLWWAFTDISAEQTWFKFHFVKYDGTTKTDMKVAYDVGNTKWQYWNNAGALADISGGTQALYDSASIWHHLVWTFDVTNNEYIELKVDDLTLDMSSLAGNSGASATAPEVNLQVEETSTNNDKAVYVDNMRVYNEVDV